MLNEVRSIVGLAEPDRRPPILLTEAVRGENIAELWEKLEEHRAALERDGRLDERRRRNLAREVFAVASGRAKTHLEVAVADDPELQRLLEEVERRELDPLTAVREIMEKVFKVGEEERSDAMGSDDGRRRSPTSRLPRAARRRRARDAALPDGDVLAALRAQVLLKAENLQRTGSFKIRGAYNTIATLGPEERARGRRRGERREPRPGGRVGGARGGDRRRRSSCPRTRRWRRSRRRGRTAAPSSWPAPTSRARWPRHSSTSGSTGATLVHAFEDAARRSPARERSGSSSPSRSPRRRRSSSRSAEAGSRPVSHSRSAERIPGQRIVGVVCQPGLTIADGISVK